MFVSLAASLSMQRSQGRRLKKEPDKVYGWESSSNLACDGLVGSVARSPPVTTRGSCASDQNTEGGENSKHPGESANDICDTCSKSGQKGPMYKRSAHILGLALSKMGSVAVL